MQQQWYYNNEDTVILTLFTFEPWRVLYEYDSTIYFGAGDGGWMYSTINYKRRWEQWRESWCSIVSGNYGLWDTITRECASERGLDILRIVIWRIVRIRWRGYKNGYYTMTREYMTTTVDTMRIRQRRGNDDEKDTIWQRRQRQG